MKNIMMIVLMLFLMGCGTKQIVQIDGMPINNNIIRAQTFNSNLKIQYNLVKQFEVKEGDEYYSSYEFISLTSQKIKTIKDVSNLTVNISIFNPNKNQYKLSKYISVEGEVEREITVYDGDLSRNQFVVDLPLIKNKLITFYYDACDKNNNLIFKSFRAQYIIEGSNFKQ